MSKSKYNSVKIDVTQNDINRGEKAEGSRCPIARAVRRAANLGGKVQISVDICNVEFTVKKSVNTYCSAQIPTKCSNFISKFDNSIRKNEVSPFSFELKIPLSLYNEIGLSPTQNVTLNAKSEIEALLAGK